MSRATWHTYVPTTRHAWADMLRAAGAKPFLTDCNTLYSGRRSNAVDHLESAMENGFNPISARCQVIIGDGVKGTDFREIPIDGATYCPAPEDRRGHCRRRRDCQHDALQGSRAVRLRRHAQEPGNGNARVWGVSSSCTRRPNPRWNGTTAWDATSVSAIAHMTRYTWTAGGRP